jgi:hypothetical protein
MRLPRPPRPRMLLVLSTWLVGVSVATAVGFGALQMIGNRVTDRATAPLSERAVNSSAANEAGSGGGRASVPRPDRTTAAPNTATTLVPPDDSPSTSPSRAPAPQVKSFPGGVVAVECEGARIMLRYAVPRVGYTGEVSNRGPEEVEVEFQDRLHRSHIAIRCVAGVPTATTSEESGDDWSRGDR